MFDFDATLPVMALQFLLLTAILNVVFYKPLTKSIEDRESYISNNNQEAEKQLAEAQALATQLEQELAESRKQSQVVIGKAQAAAKEIVAGKVAEAQAEVQQRKQVVTAEIEKQKQAAMEDLGGQVDGLSREILLKLLGPELVR
jgi:F-type H+-transporting ATPase subunit b